MATRYEKTARAFLGVLCIAATMDWLKVSEALRPFLPEVPWVVR
jgi:hypothetical protein